MGIDDDKDSSIVGCSRCGLLVGCVCDGDF